MSHQCVRCGRIYDSAAPEILSGCSGCGSHYFFFFKDEDIQFMEETEKLTRIEREEIVDDIDEVIGTDVEKPIILDLESIRVMKPGKFEIDLVRLFKKKPVIYKLEEGKYIIDIASTFHNLSKEKFEEMPAPPRPPEKETEKESEKENEEEE